MLGQRQRCHRLAATLQGRAISLYNYSIDLSNYITNAANGAFLTNNSPANLTALNVQTLNGTALNLFNRSISLVSYNQSIDLGNYPQFSNAFFDKTNYSAEYASTGWKLVNFTTAYSSEYSSSGWKIANSTSLLDNGTIIRTANLSNINVSNATYASKINCAGIYGGSDSDFCSDSSGSVSAGISLNVTNLNASKQVLLATDGVSNVGIGITNPASTLQVQGTANLTKSSTSFQMTADGNIVFHLE